MLCQGVEYEKPQVVEISWNYIGKIFSLGGRYGFKTISYSIFYWVRSLKCAQSEARRWVKFANNAGEALYDIGIKFAFECIVSNFLLPIWFRPMSY